MNLAVFRITVGVVVLGLSDLRDAARWAGFASPSTGAMPSFDWVFGVVPPSTELAWVLYFVALLAAGLGTIGLYSRSAFGVLTVVLLYLLALPQRSGAVFHYHHLVWFCALLSVSPCGDALSVDAHRPRRSGRPPRSRAYGFPIRCVWLLLGIIYLFPGVWKLVESGPAWIWSDNLRNHLYLKWAQLDGFAPLFRIDRFPVLLKGGAFFVVALELLFLPLVFFRPTRPWVVAATFAFHQMTALFMGLHFSALWLCFTVFFDWSRLLPASTGAPHRRISAPTILVATLLVTGATITGVQGKMRDWPFACYPTFQWIAQPELPTLVVELVRKNGEVLVIPNEELLPTESRARRWGLIFSLVGAQQTRVNESRLEGIWRAFARDPKHADLCAGAREIRFYRAIHSVVPEEQGWAPKKRVLLHSFVL